MMEVRLGLENVSCVDSGHSRDHLLPVVYLQLRLQHRDGPRRPPCFTGKTQQKTFHHVGLVRKTMAAWVCKTLNNSFKMENDCTSLYIKSTRTVVQSRIPNEPRVSLFHSQAYEKKFLSLFLWKRKQNLAPILPRPNILKAAVCPVYNANLQDQLHFLLRKHGDPYESTQIYILMRFYVLSPSVYTYFLM